MRAQWLPHPLVPHMIQHGSTSHSASPRRGRCTGTRAVVGVLVVTVAVAAAFAALHSRTPRRAAAAVTEVDPDLSDGQIASVQQQLSRRIYPYSVVAGGVYSTDELTAAMQNDPTVADHYRDLAPAAMHPQVVNSPRAAYMSYRIADRVYWTRRKLPLHQGETILTDGHEAVRARCGNRLSDVPRSPTSADEPAAVAFEVDTALPPPAHAVLPGRAIQAVGVAPPTGSPVGSSMPGGLGTAQPLALGGASLLGPTGYGSAPAAQTAFAPLGPAFPVSTFERRPGGTSGSFPSGTTPGGPGDPGTDPGHNGPPFIPQVPGGLSQDFPGPPTDLPGGAGGGPGGPTVTAPLVQNDTPPPSDHRTVPEPASLALWGMGMLWMARRLNRRNGQRGASR